MPNKNPPFKSLLMFIAFVGALFQPTMLSAEIGGADLVNSLNEKDHISHSPGYKISFVVIVQHHPLHDPNQGQVLWDCQATWTKEGWFAMRMTNYYEHPPIFVPLGSGGYTSADYDEHGNFMLCRSLDEHILSGPDRNDSLQSVKRFVVDPNGQILSTDDSTLLYRFPIDKPYSMYQFNHLEMAMGTGFSRHIGTVKSVETLSSGLVKVTSQGSHGPGLKGTWELSLDANSHSLVRKALFTPDGMDEPTTMVTSSGTVLKDELKLAKYGVLKYPNFPEYSVEVIGISKVAGANLLYEEVLSRLTSPLPQGTQIIDLRAEKHTMTSVE